MLIDVPAELAAAEIASDAGRVTGGGRWPVPPTGAAAPAGLTAGRGGRAGPGTVRGAPPWFLAELAAVFGAGHDPAAASDTYLIGGPVGTPSVAGSGGRRLHHLHAAGPRRGPDRSPGTPSRWPVRRARARVHPRALGTPPRARPPASGRWPR
ncbi:hypothetical protein JCM4914_16610 [Streptomyces platensis subsp. malvinus]